MLVLVLVLLLILSFMTLKGVWLGIAIGILGGALLVILGMTMLYLYIIWMITD